jgi:lactate racemase
MMTRVKLGYGQRPLEVEVPVGSRVVVAPTPAGPPPALGPLLEAALDAPIAAPRLEDRARPGDRVLIAISDTTRTDPRAELLAAVRRRLPTGVRLTVAVATGTHGPDDLSRLGLPPELMAGVELVNHDGGDRAMLREAGRSRRGTPFAVHRAVVDSDLVIATGALRPHYFAGYGAGIKAIFPGLGGSPEIRLNHRLKQEPGARAGVVDGNPCREDLEELAGLLPRRPFLLNTVADADGAMRAAVAGDVVSAFRVAAGFCEAWYKVRVPTHPVVIVSDLGPVTATLYQAAKLVAAAAPLVAAGGRIVVAAECGEGSGPLEVVNRAIFEIGVLPRLPAGATIHLVSALPEAVVCQTPCQPARSVEEAISGRGPVLVLPRAASLIAEATP